MQIQPSYWVIAIRETYIWGVGKRKFGGLMPGKRVQTTFIEDIDPILCVGYRNIIIHVGINNVKHDRVINRQKVSELSSILFDKVLDFNTDISKYVKRLSYRVNEIRHDRFSDSEGRLLETYGRYFKPSDPLHLGSSGIYMLGSIIRKVVLGDKTDGRLYANVAESSVPKPPGRSGSLDD